MKFKLKKIFLLVVVLSFGVFVSFYFWGKSSEDVYAQSSMCVEEFNYTGNEQQYQIPSGIEEITIDAYGAEGAQYGVAISGGGSGLGGRTRGIFSVNPGEVLYIYVGGEASGQGGYNGGGDGSNVGCNQYFCTNGGIFGWSGGGGGATDVRRSGTSLSNRVIVAGGGGGGGHAYTSNSSYSSGGDGGSSPNAGLDGNYSPRGGGRGGGASSSSSGFGGSGGSGQSGGISGGSGTSGTLGQGGNGGYAGDGYQLGSAGYTNAGTTGGGGGGGYYGGGGAGGGGGHGAESNQGRAQGGGGGGGSSYITSSASNTLMQTGVRQGNGYLEISFPGPCDGSTPTPIPTNTPTATPTNTPTPTPTPEPEYWIEGAVWDDVDEDGNFDCSLFSCDEDGIGGADILIEHSTSSYSVSTVADSSGLYSQEVPASGDYNVTRLTPEVGYVDHPNFDNPREGVTLAPISSGIRSATVDFPLIEVATVTGGGGDDGSGGGVVVDPDDDNITVDTGLFIDAGGNMCSSGAVAFTEPVTVDLIYDDSGDVVDTYQANESDSSGEFVCESPESGTHTLQLRGSGNYVIQGVSVNGGSLQETGGGLSVTLNLTPGDVTTVDVCLSEAFAWFQTDDGDVRMPHLVNQVPEGEYASLGSSVFFSSLSQALFGAGAARVEGERAWVVDHEYDYNNLSSQRAGVASYSFYEYRARERGVEIQVIEPHEVGNITEGGIYKVEGDLDLTDYTHP